MAPPFFGREAFAFFLLSSAAGEDLNIPLLVMIEHTRGRYLLLEKKTQTQIILTAELRAQCRN